MFDPDTPEPKTTQFPKTDAFVLEMKREFPTFSIERKSRSKLHRAIGQFLLIVTFGGMHTYVSHYHTVLFGKLWVPDAWDRMRDVDRYILLRHERIHLRQRARMGDFLMGVYYLFVFFPLGLAYGRARIEWEAYEETLRATTEELGLEEAKRLRSWLVERFVGPDYGWMWPFRNQVERWFDEAIASLELESAKE